MPNTGEAALHLDIVYLIQSKSVIYALRKHNHITLVQCNPDPLVLLVSNIKVTYRVAISVKTPLYQFVADALEQM